MKSIFGKFIPQPFVKTVATIVTGAMVAQLALAMAGEQAALKASVGEQVSTQWRVSGVRHLIGLPEVKPNAVGNLWITKKGIRFESESGEAFVESGRILRVSTGEEQLVKGGVFGRFLRNGVPAGGGLGLALAGIVHAFTVIPPAVGLAASAVMQGSEDIVTVEFLDPRDGYHGAVFTMPRHATEEIPQEVLAARSTGTVDSRVESCNGMSAQPTSLTLLPIETEGSEVPAEYRVLVYERLLERLRTAQSRWQVHRAGTGERRNACGGLTLTMTMKDFRKGNASERALLGPVGLFVGTTGLSYRMVLRDSGGASILEEQSRAVVRGDRESLDLSQAIAKTIQKKVGKLPAQS